MTVTCQDCDRKAVASIPLSIGGEVHYCQKHYVEMVDKLRSQQ